MTTQPCLNSGQGSDCSSVQVLAQGSKVSMLPSAGPSLLTMPPVAKIFPSTITALRKEARKEAQDPDLLTRTQISSLGPRPPLEDPDLLSRTPHLQNCREWFMCGPALMFPLSGS
ncbi:hypothetical protein EYF80_041089 [Liparis tanakae]|uniref:Uncharacterized protein n=1 Tax=Liparis tanakae TaxID=230148 RepID=A0A4Z2G641_9TELE|nr:hypothetical protein EYF80_041089 [Liparis tanakae]